MFAGMAAIITAGIIVAGIIVAGMDIADGAITVAAQRTGFMAAE
jgi:hypothetical protein